MPGLLRIRGFQSALLLRRRSEGALLEIEVLTFWSSMRPIRRFAGHNAELAVVEEEAKPLLERFERRVRHFEVVLNAGR